MKTIVETIEGKPSKALRAMVDGLLEQDSRSGFIVDMDTFGKERCGICFGCAATCALQKLAGVDLQPQDMAPALRRATATGFSEVDVIDFEWAIEMAREGGGRAPLVELFKFCGIEGRPPKVTRFSIEDYNWKEVLPQVEQCIKELEELGF